MAGESLLNQARRQSQSRGVPLYFLNASLTYAGVFEVGLRLVALALIFSALVAGDLANLFLSLAAQDRGAQRDRLFAGSSWSGWVIAARMWSNTNASSASARMLRSGQRCCHRRRAAAVYRGIIISCCCCCCSSSSSFFYKINTTNIHPIITTSVVSYIIIVGSHARLHLNGALHLAISNSSHRDDIGVCLTKHFHSYSPYRAATTARTPMKMRKQQVQSRWNSRQ